MSVWPMHTMSHSQTLSCEICESFLSKVFRYTVIDNESKGSIRLET